MRTLRELTFVDGHKRNVAIRFGMNFRIISLIVTFMEKYITRIIFEFSMLFFCLLFSWLLVTHLLWSNITEHFARLRLWLTAYIQYSGLITDVMLAGRNILMD